MRQTGGVFPALWANKRSARKTPARMGRGFVLSPQGGKRPSA